MKAENKGLFDQVYAIVRKIPAGKVMTYGQIAEILGTKDARKIGWALHGNRDRNTPCHRVVNKAGGMAANFAFGGADQQMKLLITEGVAFVGEKVDFSKSLYEGSED